MSKSIQVQMPSGEIIWARVDGDSPQNVSNSQMIKKLDLDELKDAIHGVSESMRLALDDLRPDEVAIEFGVELAVKSGKLTSVLAEASGKASIKIMLAWKGSADSSRPTAVSADAEGEDALSEPPGPREE